MPAKYREMLGVTIGFVVVGKLIVSPHSGSTRNGGVLRLPDFADVVRASTVSTLILLISLYLLRPFDDAIPRSVWSLISCSAPSLSAAPACCGW